MQCWVDGRLGKKTSRATRKCRKGKAEENKNCKKSKDIVLSKSGDQWGQNWTGDLMKLLQKCNYLGCVVTVDKICDTDIQKRIGKAKDAFKKLRKILRD